MKKSNTMVLKFKASQTFLCDQDRRRFNSNARTSWRCISYFSDLLQLARPYFVKLWKGSLLVLLAEKLVISLYQVSSWFLISKNISKPFFCSIFFFLLFYFQSLCFSTLSLFDCILHLCVTTSFVRATVFLVSHHFPESCFVS